MHGTLGGICGGGGPRGYQASGGAVRREINKQGSPNAGSWTLLGHMFNWAMLPAFRASLVYRHKNCLRFPNGAPADASMAVSRESDISILAGFLWDLQRL